ncbi:MAG: hypothetical protein KF694_12655 [Mesorhizobium sp.]|nr:hypothetical protein [Mesorhizobium sp.]
MSLHLKGSQLVVDLLDAADHIDRIEREEHRALLRRAADTLATLLKQDIPDILVDPASDGARINDGLPGR